MGFLDLTVFVEENAGEGFRDDLGASHLITTNLGTLLFDVGFGPDSPTLDHTAAKLGMDFSAADTVATTLSAPKWSLAKLLPKSAAAYAWQIAGTPGGPDF